MHIYTYIHIMKQAHTLYIFVLLFIGTSSLFAATDAHITGHVLDAISHEHLPYVNIQIEGTTIGTTSDESGHYFLKNIPTGDHKIVFSFMGYETLTKSIHIDANTTQEVNVELQESSFLIDHIVVTANKYEGKQREVASIVNVVSPTIMDATSSCSMADVLNYQTGLRVEMTCSNCGVPQLRINGLEGQYSQILMDSRPIFSSLASVYGLEQVPTGMVDRVEIIRGSGSALFGANAIAGVVNIITKEPSRNFVNVNHSTLLTEKGTFDINTSMNAAVVAPSEKMGVFVFAVRRDRKQYDRNDDGYSEIPKLQSTTAGLRTFFKTGTYSRLNLQYHHTTEFRRGGYGIDSLQPHQSPLTEQLQHHIDAVDAHFDYYSDDGRHHVKVYNTFQHIHRDSYFGTNYNENAYGQSRDITDVVGGQYRFSYLCGGVNSDLSTGIEYAYNHLQDQILGYHRDIRQEVHLYGGYVQNEWKEDKWSVLIGGRLEKHSLLRLPIFSPRVNVRYAPIRDVVLRVGYAGGYRAPQTYEEDLHVGAVGGEVSLISLDPDLREERSHSVNGSVDWYTRAGICDINLTAEGFFTQLDNVFALEQQGHDEQGNILYLRVNASGARVAGLNLEGKLGIGHYFSLQAGYTFQKSRYIQPFAWCEDLSPQRRMFRTPDHYGYFLINGYPCHGLSMTLNGQVTGPMLVQHSAGYIAHNEEKITPTFFTLDTKVAYEFHLYKQCTLEVSVGVKNLLDQFQQDIDEGMYKDASYIYGPALPRSYYIGLSLRI